MLFRFPGGKTKHQNRFKKYIPEFKEARFPFVGGGGIYWITDCEKKRWINDLNPHLMSVYSALRDDRKSFIDKCRRLCPGGSKEELRSTFERLKNDPNYDEAVRFFFINRTVWGGRVTYKKGLESRLFFSNPTGWNVVKNGKQGKDGQLEKAAKIIAGTKITTGRYEELLFADGEDVWIYNDPPYLKNTNMKDTDKQYEYNFDIRDHEKFVEDIKNCKHKWCVSYDDCREVREWFSGYNIYEENWTYSGTSLKSKKEGKELVITNYKVQK